MVLVLYFERIIAMKLCETLAYFAEHHAMCMFIGSSVLFHFSFKSIKAISNVKNRAQANLEHQSCFIVQYYCMD